jgi:RNA polymerase sigma-70 factor (ECF subfamily)
MEVMSSRSPDLAIGLSAPAATAGRSNEPSELEREIIGLFDQLRDRLLRYVLAFGVSVHDSEEIIQEVFLSLFRHLRSGKSRRNLRGWVFRVAHNLAIKQRYANRRSQDRLESYENVAERQPDRSPNPEEQLMAGQREKRLRAVLHVLPEQDQRCLRLRAEGLRYREIAGVLGISLGAVSISLTRSLERLGRADQG